MQPAVKKAVHPTFYFVLSTYPYAVLVTVFVALRAGVLALTAFFRASTVWAPNFFVKRSTRPSVSMSFWRPVKNGWQLEQISRCSSCLVDRVFQVAPQAHRASTSKYFG